MQSQENKNKESIVHNLYMKGFAGTQFLLSINQTKEAVRLLQDSILVFLCERFSLETNSEIFQQVKQALLGIQTQTDALPNYFLESEPTQFFSKVYQELEAKSSTVDSSPISKQETELYFNRAVEKIKRLDSDAEIEYVGEVKALYQFGLQNAKQQIEYFEQKHNCTYEAYDREVYSKENHTWEEEQETNAWLKAVSDWEHYQKLLKQ